MKNATFVPVIKNMIKRLLDIFKVLADTLKKVFKGFAGSELERAFKAAAKFLKESFFSFVQFGIGPGGIGIRIGCKFGLEEVEVTLPIKFHPAYFTSLLTIWG